MLRISETTVSAKSVILLLEGQVTNHSTDLIRETAERVLEQGFQLTLDLTGVTFADRGGIALLRELQQRQVALINSSPFLREQLKEITAV
jgi:ABC-type transporter Mla MlaB component